jgi:hypothetical protein
MLIKIWMKITKPALVKNMYMQHHYHTKVKPEFQFLIAGTFEYRNCGRIKVVSQEQRCDISESTTVNHPASPGQPL